MSLETRDAVSTATSEMAAPAFHSRKLPILICLAFTLLTALVPFIRAFFRVQVSYNEGWNVYNAARVANHEMLYPAAYSFTTVNYPALSFFTIANLGRVTHDYLFTARALSLTSLLLCCVLVGIIVRKLTQKTRPSLFAALFCLALFCTVASQYVGMDDPQMFAQVFFLAGFAVYVCKRQQLGFLALAVLLFLIGGNIKHNLLEFPLAVLLDLFLVSKRRALQFCAFGALLAGLSVVLNQHFGGPFFISQMLGPRAYSWPHLGQNLLEVLAPITLPLLIAVLTAVSIRKDPERRIVVILFVLALFIGTAFGGGKGVWINSFFGCLLATAILAGLFFEDPSRYSLAWFKQIPQIAFVYFMFGCLLIPWIISDNWRPVHAINNLEASQARFDEEVGFLRSQPGPALCDSLLRCYFAGKPYVYDPFNSTRLIRAGRLNSREVVERINTLQYGTIELDLPVEDELRMGDSGERFAPEILRSIKENYVLAVNHELCLIYIPKRTRPIVAF